MSTLNEDPRYYCAPLETINAADLLLRPLIVLPAVVWCYLGDDGPSIHDCYVHSVAAGNVED